MYALLKPRLLCALIYAVGLIDSSFAQVDVRQSQNGGFWVFSALNVSDDPTIHYHRFLRQSLGIGLEKPLSRSWSFVPSIWSVTVETHAATTSEAEFHVAFSWRCQFASTWYIRAMPAFEVESDSALPYVEQEIEVGRTSLIRKHAVLPFISWEGSYRVDGGDRDSLRLHVGVRLPLSSRFQLVPMYVLGRGETGKQTRNGATIALLYFIPQKRK